MSYRTLLLGACAVLLCTEDMFAQEAAAPLARQAQEVLKAHCARCHGDAGKAKGGFGYVLQRDQLVSRAKIVPGSAAESELFQRVRDGSMPPRDQKRRLDKDEISVLERWIDAGAPVERAAGSPRRFVSDIEVFRMIRADLEAQPARQRRFARYFTLTHLANAGRSDDDLEVDRRALAKLLNFLSWQPRVKRPVAVDAERTIFRIDLRDYRWNNRLWDRLVSAYPYRLPGSSAVAKENAASTGTDVPQLHGDWFVATASRAPLYYDLLQMPGTDRGLERLVQVDAVADIRDDAVARSGFNGSGVSKNNRVLERHDATYGAYWRTYDFSNNLERQNVFDHPLGPAPAADSFVPAGGEAIFHLPNGLHGYLLLDGNGRRVDKASVEIVSDPQRPDRAVEAGLSCMSCHARGYIHKADQVRAHVAKNAGSFSKEAIETVRALYPPENRFKALIDQDNERYLRALAQTGVRADDPEPVTAVTLRYEAIVDLVTAASEAGSPVEEFRTRLGKSATLGRVLGPLLVKAGTVQREAFQTAFADLAREFHLGDDPNPHGPTAAPFAGHTAAIRCLALSADGSLAASGSEDRTVRVWETATGKELQRFIGHRDTVSAVVFAGKRVLSAGHDRTLRLWDIDSGREVVRLEGHTDIVTCLAYYGEHLVASGSKDKTVRTWDLRGRKETDCFTGHAGAVNCVAIDSKGGQVASGSADGTVRLWQVGSGKSVRLEGHTRDVLSVAFTSPGSQVVSGSNDRTVRIWKRVAPVDGVIKDADSLDAHQAAVIALAAVPGSPERLLTASSRYQKGAEPFVRRWQLDPVKELTGIADAELERVSCVAFSADGRFALTDGPDHTLRVWKLDR